MHHVMLDLETLGTNQNAVIVSIGAVFFDPKTDKIGDEFYETVGLFDDQKGGVIDAQTVSWWINQSNDAQAIFTCKNTIPLELALKNFTQFIRRCSGKKVRIWGNGATFDNIILSSAYKRYNMEQPWSFRNDRDVRTVFEIGHTLRNFDVKSISFAGTKHHALDDARHQARCVSAVYQTLFAS